MSKSIKYCHCGIRAHGYNLCRKHYQDTYRDKSDEKYFTSIKGRYQVLKHNAKLKNREVSITMKELEDLLIISNSKCSYCSEDIGRGSAADRINNDLGYTKNNIAICCGGCNSLKGDILSKEETIEIVKLLKKLRNKDNVWE